MYSTRAGYAYDSDESRLLQIVLRRNPKIGILRTIDVIYNEKQSALIYLRTDPTREKKFFTIK